jgi:hypothetical protein
MDMPPEVRIGLISAGVVVTIAVLLLVFGDRPELAAAIRRRLAGRTPDDMSSATDRDDSHERGASGLANDPHTGLHPVATPRKAANDLSDITPAEARAIIRQQAHAETIAAILRAAESGKVKSAGDQAGLIEAVAGGARTSRPGTPYTLLKAAVDELRGKARTEYVGEMIERVRREVAGESR